MGRKSRLDRDKLAADIADIRQEDHANIRPFELGGQSVVVGISLAQHRGTGIDGRAGQAHMAVDRYRRLAVGSESPKAQGSELRTTRQGRPDPPAPSQ